MIVQAVSSSLLLVAIFLLEFNLDIREMGLGANLNALLIVLGGTLLATLIAYPGEQLIATASLLKRSFAGDGDGDSAIRTIVHLARVYRNRDVRALEQEVNSLPAGLIRIGVELICYRYTRDNIEQIMQREASAAVNRYATSLKILQSMARLAPALGLAGTIVSLIRIFSHITNPQDLIGHMAVALLCTFYGVVLANVCFVPLANKLKEFLDREELRLEIVQEGILDLYDHEHPKAIQYKLETLIKTAFSLDRASRRPKLLVLASADKSRGAHG